MPRTLTTRDLPEALRSPLLLIPVPRRGDRGCSCRVGCPADAARQASSAK